MNIQSERIADACRQLGLYAIPDAWPVIAKHALSKEQSYADFVERLLTEELKAKTARTKATLLKFAGLPNIKTLEDFDFRFASGVPKTQLQEFAGLSFIERQENIVLLGPSGVGKTHLAIALGY